jgi:hypothetical protein
MREKTWTIRDQMPDGSWGPEREVTLAQYLAETRQRADHAKAVFAKAAASLTTQQGNA